MIVLEALMKKFDATPETTQMLFCRDWTFPAPKEEASAGGMALAASRAPSGSGMSVGSPSGAPAPHKFDEKFRTTWSAGWWLTQLVEKK